MISRLFKQIDKSYRQQAYRQLYSDSIIASLLFRSLSQFQQQVIFRMICNGGQMKNKQLQKIINQHSLQSSKLIKETIIDFQTLEIFKYTSQRKTFKINQNFLQSIQSYVAQQKYIKTAIQMKDQSQQCLLQFKQPLFEVLFDKSLQKILDDCQLKYVSLQFPSQGKNLERNNFAFWKSSNSTRIRILIKGLLKSKLNKVQVLRQILYFSSFIPGQLYPYNKFDQQVIKDLQRFKLLKVIKNKYITVNKSLHNFAFQQNKLPQENQNLNIKVIIQTNYKVYVIIKSDNSKANAIVKSIMRDLLQLQHQQYSFQGIIVGTITLQKMRKVFQANIDVQSYIAFFQQYMDEEVSNNKDLGKWKKLKFLGAQGPNNQGKTPCSVKQQLLLWQSEYKYGNLIDQDMGSQEDDD